MTSAKVGRPSDYRPEYCDLVVELGKQGMLPVQMAPRCGVESRQSLHDWAKKYPEFSYAFNMARIWCEDYWLNLGKTKASGENPFADSSTIKFFLSAAFGYREKTDQSIEIEGNIHKAKEPINFKSMMIPKD
jgi:hypothetical protein